jgi:hypothetical protein
MAVALSFVDHFNGTHVSLWFGADENLPSPLQQHEIVRPLQLVNAVVLPVVCAATAGLSRRSVSTAAAPALHERQVFASYASTRHVQLCGDRMSSIGHLARRHVCGRDDDVHLGRVRDGPWTRGYVGKVQVRRQQRI